METKEDDITVEDAHAHIQIQLIGLSKNKYYLLQRRLSLALKLDMSKSGNKTNQQQKTKQANTTPMMEKFALDKRVF